MTVEASTDDGATRENVWGGPTSGGRADHATARVAPRCAGRPGAAITEWSASRRRQWPGPLLQR